MVLASRSGFIEPETKVVGVPCLNYRLFNIGVDQVQALGYALAVGVENLLAAIKDSPVNGTSATVFRLMSDS